MSRPVAASERLFTALTGRTAEGVWSAPGRVNLIGEHTDYNEGFVLPFAIERRTAAALGRRADGVIRIASTFSSELFEVPVVELDALFDGGIAKRTPSPAGESEGGGSGSLRSDTDETDAVPTQARRTALPGWAAYPLGVAWAALRAMPLDPAEATGLDLAFASDVPIGAGLSSSAAIEGATAAALNDVWGLALSPLELAQVGRTAENEAVGAPTGIMDQIASMMGRLGAATFVDCRTLQTQSVPLGLDDARLRLLVIDTRVAHAHSTGGYRDRRAACEAGAAALDVDALRDVGVDDLTRARALLDDMTFRRVRHVVTENQRVLDTVRVLREQGPRAIGGFLLASHASMRDDFEISTPELDTAVETAMNTGALGARMTGGGFGGAAIALVETATVETVTDAVQRAFVTRGFTAPHVFTVAPSEGARRDR